MKLHRVLSLCSTALLLLAASTFSPTTIAQQQNAEPVQKFTVSKSDVQAAQQRILASSFHALPANLPGAKEKVDQLNAIGARGAQLLKLDPALAAEALPALTQTPTPNQVHFYPDDLVYNGGPVSSKATFHNIYTNTPSAGIASAWGNPSGFETDLVESNFIHLTDQYTGNFGSTQHYSVDHTGYQLTTSGFTVYTDYDAQLFVDILVNLITHEGGTNHIYHLFLPPGQDICFDGSYSSCYSPDNLNTWSFCAYHGAFNDATYGTILYTVEPFQDVPGCAVQTPSPNGQLADSTNSVLSHETFETITDPVGGSGWTNQTSLDLWGYEIGDECQPLVNSSSDFLVPSFYINGKPYEVQLEYSNRYHACAMQQ
jgi:hypothetical protein